MITLEHFDKKAHEQLMGTSPKQEGFSVLSKIRFRYMDFNFDEFPIMIWRDGNTIYRDDELTKYFLTVSRAPTEIKNNYCVLKYEYDEREFFEEKYFEVLL